MSTISKMETPTDGQEETAILLEEQARRIATLQESLKQAGRIHPNEAVTLQEIKRVVEERNDLRRRLENAELLIENLKDENAGWKRDFDMFDKAQNKASILWREAHPLRDIWPSTGALTEWLMDEVGRLRGLIDNTTAKQPEGTTKLDKALQNTTVVKRVLVENSCPSEFGLEDCEFNPESGCTLCCEDCWNEGRGMTHTPDMSDLNEWMAGGVEKAETAIRTAEETNNDTHDRPVETLLLIKELGRMSKKLDALKGSLRNIADNAAHWDTGCGPDASAFGWIHDTAETAIRTAEVDGERYCHSEYGSANCKWEPGIGCTPKCPECIP